MNPTQSYVAVVDPGSSCIKACLGYKDEQEKIHIVACEQQAVDTEIRRGVIQNVDDVACRIKDLLQRLEQNQVAPCEINRVYVGLNAYTMQTLRGSAINNLNGDEAINETILDNLWEDAEKSVPENKNVLYHYVQEYRVDGFMSMNPIGERPSSLEGHYKMVIAKPQIFFNMEDCMEKAGVKDLRHLSGILASAEAVLLPEEKNRGVVVIDFGAGTTSICVYKENVVRYVVVLPFGGKNITNDLRQLNLDFSEAEAMKMQYGTALHYTEKMAAERKKEENDERRAYREPSDEEKKINEIIVARIEEIVENIWAQIQYSGVPASKFGSGIVITGAASQLKDLSELLFKKTQIPTRLGNTATHLSEDTPKKYDSPEYAQCIGLLMMGEGGACKLKSGIVRDTAQQTTLFAKEEMPVEPEPLTPEKSKQEKSKEEKPKNTSTIKKTFKGFLGSLFDEGEI